MNIETFVEDTLRIIIEAKEREARERRDEAIALLLRPEPEVD